MSYSQKKIKIDSHAGKKNPHQKSSSSTGEADNRGSGANILPPDTVKEQAEETDLKELFEDLHRLDAYEFYQLAKMYFDSV